MTTLNKQELQIIQAFSSADVPERIFRESNIKELIHSMTTEQDSVQSDTQRLEALRKEKKDGNVLGNWWHDRDDKVQDAQINLNKSIGRLTQKSSQLLIVNTAISKILNDQQRILLEQQHILKNQTDTLEEQNHKILEQQKLLEKQQQDINKANQGLMEAKGITQEQAQQLVGCVKLVKEAESRIDAANNALRSNVRQDLRDSIEQCVERLDNGFVEQTKRRAIFEQKFTNDFLAQARQTQKALEQIMAEGALQKTAVQEQLATAIAMLKQQGETLEHQLTNSFSSQSQHAKAELAQFARDSAEFKSDINQKLHVHIQAILETVSVQDAAAKQLYDKFKEMEAIQNQQAQAQKASETQLATLQVKYQKSADGNRLVIAGTAILAIFSVGWQVAQYFLLN